MPQSSGSGGKVTKVDNLVAIECHDELSVPSLTSIPSLPACWPHHHTPLPIYPCWSWSHPRHLSIGCSLRPDRWCGKLAGRSCECIGNCSSSSSNSRAVLVAKSWARAGRSRGFLGTQRLWPSTAIFPCAFAFCTCSQAQCPASQPTPRHSKATGAERPLPSLPPQFFSLAHVRVTAKGNWP